MGGGKGQGNRAAYTMKEAATRADPFIRRKAAGSESDDD